MHSVSAGGFLASEMLIERGLGCKWAIGVFEFFILVYFFSQANYVACYSNLFYQILSRSNDKKSGTCVLSEGRRESDTSISKRSRRRLDPLQKRRPG